MKKIKPAIKALINQVNKSATLLVFCLIFYAGCKPSYDDITLGPYTGDIGEIEEFNQNDYGYIIYDISAGRVKKSHNPDLEFIPASVTKLFTALFASEILGYDSTFTTTLSYDGNISKNILTGNIYLKGTGDPELSIEELQSIAYSLKLKKIREIKGNFYFDDSLFKTREMLDKSMPDDAYYNAGISSLSFNSNIAYAIKRKNNTGKITSVDMLPSIPLFGSYIYTENLTYPFLKFNLLNDKERWGFPNKNLWDNRQPLPVKQPGLYTANTLLKLCEIQGVKLPAPARSLTNPKSKILFEVESRPLFKITKTMLFASNNLTAELLYNVSAGEYFKSNTTAEAMKEFYSKGFTSLEWNNFRIFNASGLTDLNRVTPAQTVAILLFIEQLNRENFRIDNILPLSGWDGTMRNRLDHPETAFRVYAKTGSIFYASGLAGLFYSKTGQRYLFAIYINDKTKRSEYNAKIEKSAGDVNQGGLWTIKAASAIDKFITKMIEQL